MTRAQLVMSFRVFFLVLVGGCVGYLLGNAKTKEPNSKADPNVIDIDLKQDVVLRDDYNKVTGRYKVIHVMSNNHSHHNKEIGVTKADITFYWGNCIVTMTRSGGDDE